jgi:1,4-dihydroxy-2-naphthoate octaprenyltransferase
MIILKTVIKTLRPSFLVLAPVCVLLGLSTAIASQHSINYAVFVQILLAALFAHISVNTLNEYLDYQSGLDLKTTKTAFSGGSGGLPEHPQAARLVLLTGLVSLLITLSIGIGIIVQSGLQILPIGLLGIILILTYTQWLNRLPFMCLIAPGLGFGVLMIVGTHVVLTGGHSLLAWLASLVVFFLTNNLLLLNQYPDITADASVGRSTFPIVYGVTKSNWVYLFNMLAAYSLILSIVIKGYTSSYGYVAMIPMLLSVYALFGANKYSFEIAKYPQYLAANVIAAVITPIILAFFLIF